MSVFQYLGEYMKTIAESQGVEKAFEAQKEMCIRMGKQSAERIRQNPDVEEFTPQFALDYYVNGNRRTGIDTSGKVMEEKVLLTIGECPIYDGLKAAGFTDEMVERFCVNNTVYRTQLALEGYRGHALFEITEFREKREDPCLKQVTFDR